MSADPPRLSALAPEDPKRLGPYRLVGRVGAGGMGTVYAAKSRSGGYAAVKMIHGEHAAEPGFRARFAREIELLRRVRSTSVPGFIAADPEAPLPWLATEFVAGATLHQYVQESGPLSPGLLLALAAGVAEALRDIHTAGIAHRDLKPGNVLLASDGPKVLDFGIARASEDTAITATGGMVGTPGWISPEQYEGHPATDRSDVFAWGGLVAFAATGRNPFGYGVANVLAYRAMKDPPDLIGLPEPLRPVVEAAMAKDPEDRPDIDEVVRTTHRLWAGNRADSEPSGTLLSELLRQQWGGVTAELPTLPPVPRRRRLLIVGAPAAAVLLAAGGLGISTALGTAPWSDRPAETPGEAGGTVGENRSDSPGNRGAGRSEEPEPSVSLPPEAVDEAVNGPDFSRVQLNKGLPTIDANAGQRSGYTLTVESVEKSEEGLTFTAEVRFWNASPRVTSKQFYVRSGTQRISPTESFVLSVDGTSPTTTFKMTFTKAPDSGLLTFVGDPYEAGESGNPPVSFCYEVGGEFSLDYQSCV